MATFSSLLLGRFCFSLTLFTLSMNIDWITFTWYGRYLSMVHRLSLNYSWEFDSPLTSLWCYSIFRPLIFFFSTLNASILSSLPSEIITYGQWEQLKPEQKKMLPRWMKGAFCGVKKEMQETVHQQLGFILSTAPMWDRFAFTSLKTKMLSYCHCINSLYSSHCRKNMVDSLR